jgi:hypothetical protein
MRVIIAGSRDIEDYELVKQAVFESGFDITTVVCGMARGVDMLGWKWADENGMPKEEHPAKWRANGKFYKAAGMLRNIEMANVSDALIAIWDGKSPGTGHMIRIATVKGLKVFVKEV